MIFDLSNKIYVANKTEDSDEKVFKMLTGFNKSKTLVKHISYDRRCKYNN